MKQEFEEMATKLLKQAESAANRGDSHQVKDLITAAAICADKAWMFDEARNKPTY